MEFLKALCIFFVLFAAFLSSSNAFRFYVGGKDGWVLDPSEDYNHWAGRNRFQVNDTLFFKYKKGENSVLVVSKEDYYNCRTEKPILKMDGGDSEFKFHRSGPFFFISGKGDNCQKGQRLIVVVLALRHSHVTPVSPLPSPTAGAPAPVGHTPPAPPSEEPPTIWPPTLPPAESETPGATPPAESQTPGAEPPAEAQTPAATSPAAGNTPADLTAPTPAHSSAPVLITSTALVALWISAVLLSLGL